MSNKILKTKIAEIIDGGYNNNFFELLLSPYFLLPSLPLSFISLFHDIILILVLGPKAGSPKMGHIGINIILS